MYRLISRLVIYRGMEEDGILLRLSDICQRFYSGDYDKDNLITEIYEQIHSLLDLATRYGFNKNLWHNYLAFQLAMSENPFTMVSERLAAMMVRSMHLPKQIFRYSRNCLTMIFTD